MHICFNMILCLSQNSTSVTIAMLKHRGPGSCLRNGNWATDVLLGFYGTGYIMYKYSHWKRCLVNERLSRYTNHPFFLFVLIITHVAVDDVYDEIKTCSQHRVTEKAQILKISFIIHVKSILSWFSQLLFTGNQSPQFIFLFSSCEKVFPLHAYCFRKSGFFFKLLFWKKKIEEFSRNKNSYW